jgi:hypothetical protein
MEVKTQAIRKQFVIADCFTGFFLATELGGCTVLSIVRSCNAEVHEFNQFQWNLLYIV